LLKLLIKGEGKMINTALTEIFQIEFPIIQAGMAGKVTNAKLVSSVCHGGGLGTLGAGYMSPEMIRYHIGEIRKLTTRPFAVNLLIQDEEYNREMFEEGKKRLAHYYKQFNINMDEVVLPSYTWRDQLNVLIEEQVEIFSFAFGVPDESTLKYIRSKGIKTIGTATSVKEACFLEEIGIDAVVAQGLEAGGHRGGFFESDPLVGSLALIPQIVDHLQIPVIAAGGIMDGRGVVAAFSLGASGVQLGTAFLSTFESEAHPKHKEALFSSTESSTELTTSFSGKLARGLTNKLMKELSEDVSSIAPYPLQHYLTAPIRQKATLVNDERYMGMWGGQGSRYCRLKSAHSVVRDIIRETNETIKQLSRHSSLS
jgi:nitronate monooxygenase